MKNYALEYIIATNQFTFCVHEAESSDNNLMLGVVPEILGKIMITPLGKADIAYSFIMPNGGVK